MPIKEMARKILIQKIILLFCFIIISSITIAQPSNDACSNAAQINLGASNMGIGIYTSATFDLTNATIETNEYFHPNQVDVNNNSKSIWFKFSIPTARYIRVELKQPPANLIAQDGAGFTVFKTNSCSNLSETEVIAAKLNSVPKFGNSFNPCLLPGDYLIQVSAKSNANGPVFIEIETDYTGVLDNFDLPSEAYDFGTIQNRDAYVNFSTGCQSIDNLNGYDVCNPFNANYTQSAWFVFKTGHRKDHFLFRLLDINNGFINIRDTILFKLYKGNVKTAGVAGTVLVEPCQDVDFSPTDPWEYYSNYSFCSLDSNSYYSVQLIYPATLNKPIRFYVRSFGNHYTLGAKPSNLHPNNFLGNLPVNVNGISTYAYDEFGCNALMSQNICGANQPSQIVFNNDTFKLATWFVFNLTESANLFIGTWGEACCGDYLKRLFAGDIRTNCNLNLLSADRKDSTFICLAAGTYSLQLLGTIKRDYNSHSPNYYAHFGRPVNLVLTAQKFIGKYDLSAAGMIDTINAVSGTQQPMPVNTFVNAEIDYFTCKNTVLPAGILNNCNGTSSSDTLKAIYRILKFDRSGTLFVMAGGPCSGTAHTYRLYQGDANALAIAQNAYNYPQRINGLTAVSSCYYLPNNCISNRPFFYACVNAGTYTLVTFGGYEDIGIEDRPQFLFVEYQSNLSFAADYENVNEIAGNAAPMPIGQLISTNNLYFPCHNTVLPAGDLSSCQASTINDTLKAIYRKIVIDRNGILTVYGGTPNCSGRFHYRLYRGDAAALAQAQNAFDYPQRINGLEDLSGCQVLCKDELFKVCVTPGVYTLVTMGGSNSPYPGFTDQPKLQFDTVSTKYNNPAYPNVLPNIVLNSPIYNSVYYGGLDYFSCINNPETIDGFAPCTGFTKQLYREFYLTENSYIRIFSSAERGILSLFKGRASQGLNTLQIYSDTYYGPWHCFNYRETSCGQILPAGWYTLVSYGRGEDYANPDYTLGNGGDIGYTNNVCIVLFPPPKYNRPHLASPVNNGNPLTWGPNIGSAAYPSTARRYTANRDNYDCKLDIPFSTHPIDACSNSIYTYNRISYYVFNLSQESFVHIDSIPPSMMAKVYPFDVRTSDSLLMISTQPLQPCISINAESKYHAHGGIEFCKLQPGTYTLVCFAGDSNLVSYVQPSFYVDKVETSRFDFASKAYDFNLIPTNGVEYFGKIGDTNPLQAGRKPSHDFISCTTGAFRSDPGKNDVLNDVTSNKCGIGDFPSNSLSSVPYPMPNNYTIYNEAGDTTYPFIRRNLWYTFVLNGPGVATVKAYSKSPNTNFQFTQAEFPISVYESDVDGNLNFSTVVSSNLVDSTIQSGLRLVATSRLSCDHQTASFTIHTCEVFKKRRFYVVVDNLADLIGDNDTISNLLPNQQVEIGVKFEPLSSTYLTYDHIGTANVINGLQQQTSPYTYVELGEGTYLGDTASFACATRSTTDPPEYASCANRTLWYKFHSVISGNIRINYDIPSRNQKFLTDARNMQLYREIIPNDSVNGLEAIPQLTVTTTDTAWAVYCMTSGTYYLMFTGCDYTVDNVVPRIRLISNPGDICENAVQIQVNNTGNFSGSCIIDCHTMGQDFGEGIYPYTNLGCMLPANESVFDYSSNRYKYKTSWFQVIVNLPQKIDLTISLNPNAYPLPIAYRTMLGTCGAMNAYLCSTDPYTGTTLRCVPGTGVYFVQVLSPITSTGNVELLVSIANAADPTCVPVVTSSVIADYIYTACHLEDTIQFFNRSTAGRHMKYLWNFGDGTSSNLMHPAHQFPQNNLISKYPVTLTATDTVRNITATKTDTLILYPAYPKILPNDTIICGDSLLIKINIPEGSPLWSDQSTNDTLIIRQSGTYYIDIYNTCRFVSDTIQVHIYPIPPKPNLPPIIYGCEGEDLKLLADSISHAFYFWQGPNGFTSNDMQPVIVSVSASNQGVYSCYVSVDGCISPTSQTNVVVNPIPITPQIWSNSPICVFDTLKLFANLQPNASYHWSGPLRFTSNLLNPEIPNMQWGQDGYYSLYTMVNNCGGKPDSILVSFKEFPIVNLGNDTIVCVGNPLKLEANAGFINYLWNTGSTQTYIQVDSSGYYIVEVTNYENCKNKDTIYVQFNTYPQVNLGNDTIVCSYQPITLNAGNGYSAYLWSNGSDKPAITVNKEGTVWVEVFNGPCMKADTIILFSCETKVWVPSAFTPNGDGLNDEFGVIVENVNKLSITIFNRWGQVVYKSNDYNAKWNGTMNGSPCPEGVYSYIIQFEGSGETEATSIGKKQGYVVLIR